MHNFVNFFRFNGRYEDVFVEGNGSGPDSYLYACADPFNWAHMLQCCTYYLIDGKLVHGEYVSADPEYLSGLRYAPKDIAEEIIQREYNYCADWACPDCTDDYDDPVILDYYDDDADPSWQCPECGCTTRYPDQDACLAI